MNIEHTMSVAQLIKILQRMPQDLPVEINNHHTGNLSWVDAVGIFDETCEMFDVSEGDYPCVVIQTETWATR
jgi:hypothetical protein